MSETSTEKKDIAKLKRQRRLLIDLAFRGGEVSKVGDLKPKLDANLRNELAGKNLLAVGKKAGSLHITLQDAGWRWVMEHLTEELPDKEQVSGILMRVLSRISTFLKANSIDVQDLIQATCIGQGTQKAVVSELSPKQALLRLALDFGGGNITEQIRLRDIRPRMEELGYTRTAVDQAILNLQRDGTLSVIPIDLPTDLDNRDHAAAIDIGGVPRHALIVRRR